MKAEVRARAANLEWQAVDDEVVILDLRRQCYLSLNRSGARLWPMVVAGTSRPALVDALAAAYGIGEEAASRDTDVLLAQLAAADLLEESGHPAPDQA